MILAAIEGQLLVLVLMAVFGIISWISNKLNEKKQPPPPPRAPGPGSSPRPAADSEEERMRRFMEALGLPADQMPSRPQQPQPERPRIGPLPVPPTVVPPLPPPTRPKPRPVPPPAIPATRSLDELETTSLPVEQITLPDLVTPEIHEFETVTSRITAAHERAPLLREAAPVFSASSVHTLLRAALSSPEQLRSAFVLREILGPPPGLRG